MIAGLCQHPAVIQSQAIQGSSSHAMTLAHSAVPCGPASLWQMPRQPAAVAELPHRQLVQRSLQWVCAQGCFLMQKLD